MEAVGRVVPALPLSLVSTAMLEADDQPLTPFEIKGRVSTLDRRPRNEQEAMFTSRAPTATMPSPSAC